MTTVFRKARAGAPAGFFACEAAGLRWLAAAGGVGVVGVLGVDDDALLLERLDVAAPTRAAAWRLGADLATTHGAGAPAFGSPPDGWSGDLFVGPLADPLVVPAGSGATWGEAHARLRLRPLAEHLAARGHLSTGRAHRLDRLAAHLADGRYDDDLPPARLHGDLWSGNVVWTPAGAVLVDPAAHGGHPLADLAMLDLFGLPHLGVVLDAYAQARGDLPDGWRDLLGLHQVFPVGLHVALFGEAYGPAFDALLRTWKGPV